MIKRRNAVTLSQWMLLNILVIFVILFVVVITLTTNISNVMSRQVSSANALSLQLYMEGFNSSIESMEKFLASLPKLNSSIADLTFSKDKNQRILAISSISNDLVMNMSIHNYFDGIFIYSNNGVNKDFLHATTNRESHSEVEELKEAILSQIDSVTTIGWHIFNTKNNNYILRVNKQGTTYCGAWIRVESVLRPFLYKNINNDGIIAFIDDRSHVLASTKPLLVSNLKSQDDGNTSIQIGSEKYMINIAKTRSLNASFAVLMPYKSVTKDIHNVQKNIILIFAFLGVCVFVGIHLSNRRIAYPVRNLSEIMALGEGLSGRADVDGHFIELNLIATNLNKMMERIQQLQKHIYERKISEQKTKLQYLQLRIRPHFLLNSLNIIYSFAQIQNYTLVQQMTMCLVKYFRYILYNENELVSLEKELEHICNYIEIQKMRYTDNFIFEKKVTTDISRVQIPPLTIQTFVENSIKYALDGELIYTICLEINEVVIEGKDYIEIIISDNGPGYPEHILNELEANNMNKLETIGIYNTWERLKVIYEDDFNMKFYNKTIGGASTTMIIPLKVKGMEEEG